MWYEFWFIEEVQACVWVVGTCFFEFQYVLGAER